MFLKQTILSDAVLNNEGLKIVYDDVAPYAKENSNPQVIDPGLRPRVGLHPRKGLHPRATTTREEYPDLKRNDVVYPGYALCLPGFALLNGDYINFPDVPDGYGYISDEVSDANGNFKYMINEEGLRPRVGLHPQMFLFPRSSTPIKPVNPKPPNTRTIIRYSPSANGSNMTETRQPNSQYVGVGYMPAEMIEHENILLNTEFKKIGPSGTPNYYTIPTELTKAITGNELSLTQTAETTGRMQCVQTIKRNSSGINIASSAEIFIPSTTITSSDSNYYVRCTDSSNSFTDIAITDFSTIERDKWVLIKASGLTRVGTEKLSASLAFGKKAIGTIKIRKQKLELGIVSTEYTPAPSEWLPDPTNYEWIPIQEYGKYIDAPALTVKFNQKFTSVGLLLTFNSLSGDYANRINVQWFSDNELISSMDYEPDSVKYFCNNYVMLYDKIVITFLSTSKPNRPVFLSRIDYGIYRDFLSDEVRQISCLQEINAISENISINTMNFTVRTKSSVPFDLQKKQKLSLYFNGGLIGNFYLKNGAKKSKTDYFMDSHDALGILDGNEYHGGIYTGQLVPAVIANIFEDEDFNYLLSDTFDNVKLYGYIPYTTKRNALVQIAFAIGAVVDTSNYDGVVIYPKQEAKTGEFASNEVFGGLTLEHSDVVTGVRLTVHDYHKSDEMAEIYKGVLDGTAEAIFTEAYHSLSITGGTITASGDNYAFITGSGGEVILTGKKYNHFTSTVIKENPNIIFNKNIKEVPDATLVYKGNAASVLERIYEYYQHAENVVCDVLLSNKVIGQVVDIDTDYDGVKTGTIESVSYSFAGSIKAEVTIHE
jgi:hypothetical protein